MEHTLTDGYALALALEAERLRMARRMAELARTVEHPEETGELRRIATRLIGAETELSELRGLLADLRRYAEARRAA